jgi:hypothetical protein
MTLHISEDLTEFLAILAQIKKPQRQVLRAMMLIMLSRKQALIPPKIPGNRWRPGIHPK